MPTARWPCWRRPATPSGRCSARSATAGNIAVLHRDAQPHAPPQRSLGELEFYRPTGRDRAGLSVTYWMNRLQPLGGAAAICSLRSIRRAAARRMLIHAEHYAHPHFDRARACGPSAGCGRCKAATAPGSAAHISARASTRMGCRRVSPSPSNWAAYDVPGRSRTRAAASSSDRRRARCRRARGSRRMKAASRPLQWTVTPFHRACARASIGSLPHFFAAARSRRACRRLSRKTAVVFHRPLQPVLLP